MALSAHCIKGGRNTKRDRPRPESMAGKVYDKLIRGELVNIRTEGVESNNLHHMMESLRDNYNLEIESRYDGTTYTTATGIERKSRSYFCVGKWEGTKFQTVEEVRQALDSEGEGR